VDTTNLQYSGQIPWYILWPTLGLVGGLIFHSVMLFLKYTPSKQALINEARFQARRYSESEYFVKSSNIVSLIVTVAARLDVLTADAERIYRVIKFVRNHPDFSRVLQLERMEKVRLEYTNFPLPGCSPYEECAYLRLKKN
jgi:hypothetical protein